MLPMLRTERLLLRPLKSSDAPALHTVTNHPQVSANMLDMPHPYPEQAAANMIDWSREAALRGDYFAFGIIRQADNALLGVIFIKVDNEDRRGELGYWLGVEYSGQGYATEAARRMLQFAFEKLLLNRIYAYCFTDNSSSAKVLEKIGMQCEGVLRRDVVKDGVVKDVAFYGLLRSEYAP